MGLIHAVATHTGFFLCKTAEGARIRALKEYSGDMYGWLFDVRDEYAFNVLTTLNATIYMKVAAGDVKEMSIDSFIHEIRKAEADHIFDKPKVANVSG